MAPPPPPPTLPVQLTSLPTEILFLIIFCIDNAKDLRSLSSTNNLFRVLAGPHTVTAQLWFTKHSHDIPPGDLLKVAKKWRFPLEFEFAKKLITINAPPEPPGISSEPPGPKRALERQERVMHIVERFSLFLHNMLAVNYYPHNWDSLKKVADSVECYLEDFGWVQFYHGQINHEVNSMTISKFQADQEFDAIAFEDFTRKLKKDITTVSTMTTSSSKNTSTNNSRHNSGLSQNINNDDDSTNDNNDNIGSSELFASRSPESVYLRWTSLIQDQLNFFCLQQYIMNKFKPPSNLQLSEYLSVVLKNHLV